MPNVTLCRFTAEGKLDSFEADLESTNYIAISHVWGHAIWTNVPGINRSVKVSKYKADFLNSKLPNLVRELPFWMDVLCVDQRSKAARIAVVKYIPHIYRNAVRTIAIRDGDGFRGCCADSITSYSSWLSQGKQDLFNHVHRVYMLEGLSEVYLFRLWPLEEIILSDNVQFEVCADRKLDLYIDEDSVLSRVISGTGTHRVIASLHALYLCWFRKGRDDVTISEDAFGKFVEAFMTCRGIISRPTYTGMLDHPSSSNNLWYYMHINSMRATSKPRDFVIVEMAQYRWYTVPAQAGNMTFSELFLDCYSQAHRAGLGFNSKLVEMEGAPSLVPAREIPTPTCLGDFLKLLGPPSLTSLPSYVAVVGNTFRKSVI